MKISMIIIEALENLVANKARTLLTILGILIGVGAVIAMMAIGSGVKTSVTSDISSSGSNQLQLYAGNWMNEDEDTYTFPKMLTVGDAEALFDPILAPSVLNAVPILNDGVSISFSGKTISTTAVSSTPAYQPVTSAELTEGSFFTEQHMNDRASVVILGPEIAKKLFGRDSGVTGQQVRINEQSFKVIGVLKAKGGGGMNDNPDKTVLIPITTARVRFSVRGSQEDIDYIVLNAKDANSVDSAKQEVTAIMRERHQLTSDKANDFTIISQNAILGMMNKVTGTLTIFLGGVAGISLLVGGIGIMNIMLVSVTERTREIGLRKALGATTVDILSQFLVESALISLVGGILGILLGWVISMIVSFIAKSQGVSLAPLVGLDAILLSTLFSIAIGLFFGIYPANRASKLQPVEALRHE